MIPFISYSVLFSVLVWLALKRISPTTTKAGRQIIFIFFLLKISAVPIFYLVYEKQYGGIENLDTGKFYHDARVIAAADRSFFWKALVGLQDDTPGSEDYEKYLKQTKNWDNGTVKDYLYNDNRVVIRFHAFLDAVTFDSYLVHALFNCLLSCIGIWLLFTSFRSSFKGKEYWLLALLCFFPALWFYSGALLKEGLCLATMGIAAKSLQIISHRHLKGILLFLPAFLVSCFLKPYLLLPFLFFSFYYFFVGKSWTFRKQALIFAVVVLGVFSIANALSLVFKNRSLPEAALQHQKRFEAVSHGGVFLSDGYHYLQLPPDTNLIQRTDGPSKKFRIRPGTKYMFWKPDQPADTLYATAPAIQDSSYTLLYYLAPAGSNLELNKRSPVHLLLSALYHTFCQPFFLPVKGPLQLLASFENLLLLTSLLIIILYGWRSGVDRQFILVFLTFALFISILTAITAPNSGAIFRYRAPAVIFIPAAATLLLPLQRKAKKSASL